MDKSAKEKLKTGIIIALVCIIVFGGSFVSSELSYYKNKCDSCNKEEKKSNIKSITINDYLSLLSGNKLSLIYIGSDTCPYSEAQDLVFQELYNEYDIIANYINLNKLADSDLKMLYDSSESFTNDGIGTPTLLLAKDKEIKLFKRGYTSKENLIELLKENKYIVE